MRIAVIPARGGSKRIPRKNIKTFAGRPMIAWSITAALESGLFEHVIVSTDDPEIRAIAQQWGATVPFVRPAELSDDFTGTTAVIAHATQWACEQGWPVQAVCCIYATAPFLRTADLLRAQTLFATEKWAYVFTATEFAAPIFRSFQSLPQGGLEMFYPEHFGTRSQDLPQALHDAGQFYWGKTASWLQELPIFASHSHVLHIPRWRVQDIDTDADWRRAELLAPLIMENACASE